MDYDRLIKKLLELSDDGDEQALLDAYQLVRNLEVEDAVTVTTNGLESETLIHDKENFEKAHAAIKEVRARAAQGVRQGSQRMVRLYRDCLLFDAPYYFDEFCRFIEFEREPEKKFYEPRRKQLLPIVSALQDLADDKLDLLAISMPPGVGKALANDTPIFTRDGWKNHGDLQIGDEVIGLNGEFKKVLFVHPKCQLDVLVEFTNGEKIQCHENHEWLAYDRGRSELRLEETKYYEKRKLEYGNVPGKRGHRYVLQLPERKAIIGDTKRFGLHPYLLGVWLGDGANKNPRICGAESDHAIIDKIVNLGYPVRWQTKHKTTGVMYYDFNIRTELQKYGMCHSRKITDKHIPIDYLTADYSQRMELLAGLIDTDGTYDGKGKYTFTTADKELKETFLDLIATFGWRTCVTEIPPKESSSGIKATREHYRISFTPDGFIPCALTRKQNQNPSKQRAIAFKSISRVEPKEGNCITVEGDGMYLAGKSMLPTHNTTTAIFYVAWMAGKRPELQNLICSHNNEFLRGVYDEVLRVTDPYGEYLWQEVFPDVHVVNTNAKGLRIDYGTRARFETIEMTARGSQNAGKVRATNLLYCDDLVSGIEEAMSRDQMDKLWQVYTDDFRQRKQGNRVKELHIATRWSVSDVIGRLERSYEGNDRARFIRCPALDENDESLWDYPYGLGYDTETLHEQREIMDDASWRALYMNEPIEREGQLYAPQELRRYFDLPEKEPDAIIAVCDTKEQGSDDAVMPIAYQYGNDFYIDKFICDNGKPDVIEQRIVELLVDRKVQMAQFESNRGGTIFAENVRKGVREKGGNTSITTKWNQTNKETRILVASGWVKAHCLFKDESLYAGDKEYRSAMSKLCGYTMAGRNAHDDVPDAMADLANFVQSFEMNRIEISRRIF